MDCFEQKAKSSELVLALRRCKRCDSTLVDVLVAVTNRGDLSPLIECLSTLGADAVHVGGILASVPYMGKLLMH